MIVVDTGPIVALVDRSDDHHERCKRWFLQARGAREELPVPAFVVLEVCQLLEQPRRGGPAAEARLLRDVLTRRPFAIYPPDVDDLHRMSELVETYAVWPLGAADAAVVATAERFDIATVATIDRRHFGPMRPRHVSAFTLVPEA